MEDLMKAFINKSDERFDTHGTTIRNLQRQVRQTSNLLSERATGTLSSDIEKNPKKITKDVSLRSGKILIDKGFKIRADVVIKQTKIIEEKKSGKLMGKTSDTRKEVEESKHMPTLPFPQKLKREKLDKYFG